MSRALIVEGLSYRYPDGTLALDGVDMVVDEGELVAIVGPNGAGKTTLLLHFNGMLRPMRGRVEVFGVDVSRSRTEDLARLVGVVFQDPDDQLFMPTLYDDVAFGPLNLGLPGDEVERRVEEALRRMGLYELKDRPPHHLSYGQRRKAAIAAVLAMRPRLVALDEPTANLDPRGRREVVEVIKGLIAEGVTVVVATHDLDLVHRLRCRVYLLNRRVVGVGWADEVLGDEGLMAEAGLL